MYNEFSNIEREKDDEELLQNWLANLLEKTNDYIDHLFHSEELVKQQLESLNLPRKNGYTVGASRVSEPVIEKLNKKIKGITREIEVWNVVLWYLENPLPVPVAHDLIDRIISISSMSFTRQKDEVQWRLATIDEDALYILIRERYIGLQYSTIDFKNMLKLYWMQREGILQMLSFYEASSLEKENVYRMVLEGRIDIDD